MVPVLVDVEDAAGEHLDPGALAQLAAQLLVQADFVDEFEVTATVGPADLAGAQSFVQDPGADPPFAAALDEGDPGLDDPSRQVEGVVDRDEDRGEAVGGSADRGAAHVDPQRRIAHGTGEGARREGEQSERDQAGGGESGAIHRRHHRGLPRW